MASTTGNIYGIYDMFGGACGYTTSAGIFDSNGSRGNSSKDSFRVVLTME